ncbi:MAG TPA: hypothetical protein VHG89_05715 [Verrucomicrobiae bacterium]|nr:hypothetical protein [Verrucomicrobiae bacterium]
MDLNPKVAQRDEIEELKKLSTERLIIWIVGRSKELGLKLTPEEIVLECWLINPEKHSLRGYSQFPCSQTVLKRVGEMKGKKGLLTGSEMSGYELTEISKRQYADLVALVQSRGVSSNIGSGAANREISSMDEAPYKRLKKTPAYEKFAAGRPEQIVETDFLYFYGISWHTKRSIIHNRIKNVDAVAENFSSKDSTLHQIHKLLNEKFANTRKELLEGKL